MIQPSKEFILQDRSTYLISKKTTKGERETDCSNRSYMLYESFPLLQIKRDRNNTNNKLVYQQTSYAN